MASPRDIRYNPVTGQLVIPGTGSISSLTPSAGSFRTTPMMASTPAAKKGKGNKPPVAPPQQGGGNNPPVVVEPPVVTPPVDPMVQRLAHRIYGAGYNSGAAPATGDGTAKSFTSTVVNESGASISKASVAFQGWTLRSTGTTDASASYEVTGTVEYPAGTTVGNYTCTVVPGTMAASTEITLTTPIPAAATFVVKGSSTVTNGATYIASLGFAGLRTHALKSTLKKIAVGAFGDSIMTNNNGAFYNAAAGRCPVYVASIIGTLASTYVTTSSATNFSKQVDLCAFLGLTDITTNFGTNDFGASAFAADLQTLVSVMRDAARAKGLRYNHCTMLPRTNGTLLADSVSSLTSVGTTLTAVVPDPTKFVVGMPARCVGADQTEYVGSFVVTAIDNAAKTVIMLFPGSATPTATGTITLGSWKMSSHIAFMTVSSSKYAAGAASERGKFNAWLRAGNVDGYVEWADAVEPSRDAGRWLVAGESVLLPAPQLITVSSVTNTSRFNSNYNRGSSTMANGFVQPATGANTGIIRNGSGNTNGDITVTTAFPNTQVVGDTYWAVPGVAYISDDGLHPRVSGGGKGGQALLDAATAAWIDAKLAA